MPCCPNGEIIRRMATNKHSAIEVVSFEKVPLIEIGSLAQSLVAAGWEWQANTPAGWTAVFEKRLAADETLEMAHGVVERIMGDYYIAPAS